MKLLITLLLAAVLCNMSCASEIKLLKFVTKNNEYIYLYSEDIINLDTVNSVISLSPKAITKLNQVDVNTVEVFVLNLKNEWERINLVSARSAERNPSMNSILFSQAKLLFYSESQIVVQGDIWKALALKNNIPVK